MLRINFDETAVCLFQGAGRGNVFLAKNKPAVQNVPIGKRRTYLTHVAFVCDDPAIQPALPQVVIGNEHTIKARQLDAMRATCMPNVRVLRRKSAWVCWQLIAQIVRWLAEALEPFIADVQPILFFDACKAHLHSNVFAACAAANIWAVVLAAKMTRLLQPLDTHTFQKYKIYLQKAYQTERIRSASGNLDVAGLLLCVNDAVRSVLHAIPWAAAFDGDGLGPGQAALRDRVAAELQLSPPFAAPDTRPSLVQIQCCFPKRFQVPVASIWRPFEPPAPPGEIPKAAAPALRRSARIAAKAAPARAHAVRGPMPRPPGRSLLLGARPKFSAAPPPPTAPVPCVAVAKIGALAPRPKAAASGGIMTRSRTRDLG